MRQWVEVERVTGQRRLLEQAEVDRLTGIRQVNEKQAAEFLGGRPFETEYYWYRPARITDFPGARYGYRG